MSPFGEGCLSSGFVVPTSRKEREKWGTLRFDHERCGPPAGLADQMNVLGHGHVSDYDETIADPHLFENLQEEIPPPGCAE
jgi:hypothetical protein